MITPWIKRAKGVIFATSIAVLLSFESSAQSPAPSPAMGATPATSSPRIVATFSCLSIYWSPVQGSSTNTCAVSYRKTVGGEWHPALPLWYDARNKEYRGSIVSLQAGTDYEIRLQLANPPAEVTQQGRTWDKNPPIAETVTLPGGMLAAPYIISKGGSSSGYILYTTGSGQQTVIDGGNHADNCVEVNAPYVVIRGLKLVGPKKNGIFLGPAAHDVVIENCDISGWGRIAADGWGTDMDAGIYAKSPSVGRIIIRENVIHNPRSNANDWTQARPQPGKKSVNHPGGPQAIVFFDSQGNNVICHNEVFSDENHRFNDGIGGGANFSTAGFPGPDSDIYGNIVRNSCDDALEIEGGGCNVRIWGNYMDTTFTGVSSAVCSVGPLYIFRNVLARTRSHAGPADAVDNTGIFGKLGDKKDFGRGRRYYFHNTLLQPQPKGASRPLGAGWAIADWGGLMTNTVSRNNIWQTVPNLEQVVAAFRGDHAKNHYSIVDHKFSPTNDLDHDLLTCPPLASPGQEKHAIYGAPIFVDAKPEETMFFALAPSSPGLDAGEILPNFNDDFLGKAPDLGAQESGAPKMTFGLSR